MLLVGGGCLALHQRGRAAWEGISGSGWGPKGLWALSVTVRDSQAQACNQQQEPTVPFPGPLGSCKPWQGGKPA